MITVKSKLYQKVIVLGHVIMYDTIAVDMRIPAEFQKMRNHFVCEWFDYEADETLEEFIFGIIEEDLPASPLDWGDNEQCWDKALSGSKHMRMMVALNGKHLEQLYTDKSACVRAAVAQSLTNSKALGFEVDASLLDVLINDKKYEVREAVACYGKPEHIDILVSDRDINVRMAAARHASENHLEAMMGEDAEYVMRTFLLKSSDAVVAKIASDHASETMRDMASGIAERRLRNLNS